MGEPNYPEKHAPRDCNDGQCKDCEKEPPPHDCKADGKHGCEVCMEYWGDKADDLDESRADEERMERKEGSEKRA